MKSNKKINSEKIVFCWTAQKIWFGFDQVWNCTFMLGIEKSLITKKTIAPQRYQMVRP